MYEHESLVRAIKQVDVVISAVGYAQLNDQDRILAAIKEAGNVKVPYICINNKSAVWRLLYLNFWIEFDVEFPLSSVID